MKTVTIKISVPEAIKLIAVCNQTIESEKDILESLKTLNHEPHVRQMIDNSITFITAIKKKIKAALAERG